MALELQKGAARWGQARKVEGFHRQSRWACLQTHRLKSSLQVRRICEELRERPGVCSDRKGTEHLVTTYLLVQP